MKTKWKFLRSDHNWGGGQIYIWQNSNGYEIRCMAKAFWSGPCVFYLWKGPQRP